LLFPATAMPRGSLQSCGYAYPVPPLEVNVLPLGLRFIRTISLLDRGARRVESAAPPTSLPFRDTSAALGAAVALCRPTNSFAGEQRLSPPWGVPACSIVWS